MSVYKEMYLKLFSDISKTIEELQKAQQECERLYIETEPHLPIAFKNSHLPGRCSHCQNPGKCQGSIPEKEE